MCLIIKTLIQKQGNIFHNKSFEANVNNVYMKNICCGLINRKKLVYTWLFSEILIA